VKRAPGLAAKTVAVTFITVAIILSIVFIVLIVDARDRMRDAETGKLEASSRIFTAFEARRDRDQLATTVVRTLERYAPGIWNAIEHRQVLTPVDLEETYGLTRGHIHHGEQSIDQLFSMRPTLGWAQYRTPIDGLFLCGAGTHPGGAITGLSGRNAARVIAKALHRGSS
jgi:hypothetical protein